MECTKSLPTPKLVRPCESNRWYRFYAMFSEDFAKSAIELAGLSRNSTILDPWVGVGTTTSIAASLGFRAIGVDINPVMVAIARGRTVSRNEAKSALEQMDTSLANASRDLCDDDPLLTWFTRDAARELRHWQRATQMSDVSSTNRAATDFLLTCLFETARGLATPFQSKNPTWLKRPTLDNRIDVPWATVRKRIRDTIKKRLAICHEDSMVHSVELHIGSSTSLPGDTNSVDFVLTSPPYCTRIDYAVTTQVELAVLNKCDLTLRALRDSSMGTSTIRSGTQMQPDKWGPSCIQFVNEVRNHSSKASQTYYLKTFLQYFSDLWTSLVQIDRVLHYGGLVAIVVQDSYYKGIRTDLATIVVEMGQSLGWRVSDRCDFDASRTMRSINTRSRKYRSEIAGTESVLWLHKRENNKGGIINARPHEG